MTASPEVTGSGPYELVPSSTPYWTRPDWVFVDAVGTGYCRPVGKGTTKDFAGTDQDVQAFSRFIQTYVGAYHRWNSPKFLFGESYGTTRSAALVDELENGGMSFNGVVLMSTILNSYKLLCIFRRSCVTIERGEGRTGGRAPFIVAAPCGWS